MATGDSDEIIPLHEAVRILFGDTNWYFRMSQTSASESASSRQQPQMATPKRFELPAYNPQNPELWFLTCELIFDDYEIETEKKKFSAILQRLGPEQVTLIESIVRQKPDDAYTQAKRRIIAADGVSEEERLNQLLRGADIPAGTKPCIVLQKLRALAGGDPEADKYVRPIWLAKLPIRTQEVLSANQGDPLDTICKTADKMHEINERSTAHVHAVAAASTQPATTTVAAATTTDCLATVIRLLTSEVAALRADRKEFEERRSRDRSRDRGYNRYRSRSRPRSQTPGREQRTELIDGVCWYHYTFGDKAYKCAEGCKRKQGNEK